MAAVALALGPTWRQKLCGADKVEASGDRGNGTQVLRGVGTRQGRQQEGQTVVGARGRDQVVCPLCYRGVVPPTFCLSLL